MVGFPTVTKKNGTASFYMSLGTLSDSNMSFKTHMMKFPGIKKRFMKNTRELKVGQKMRLTNKYYPF